MSDCTCTPYSAGGDGPEVECSVHGMKPGDWIAIYAKIAKDDGLTSPEDVRVELASHSDHYAALVRRDYVWCMVDAPFHLAGRCASLTYPAEVKGDELLRCRLHGGHRKAHEARTAGSGANYEWDDGQTVGFVEAP